MPFLFNAETIIRDFTAAGFGLSDRFASIASSEPLGFAMSLSPLPSED
jgi:hypothetical protein